VKSPSSSSPFWNVWLQHKDQLQQQSLRLMAGNVADAEDALNTAMLRARQRYMSAGIEILNEKAWLSRILYNVCMDMHRERRRWGEPEELQEGVDLAWAVPAETLPEAVLLQRERAEEIQERILSLPPSLRLPFVMRFQQEMSYSDIALHLQLTNCNVRKRIQLAYGILRGALAEALLAR
jgi:RNA polymerase sigma factor (sigma-70 family)